MKGRDPEEEIGIVIHGKIMNDVNSENYKPCEEDIRRRAKRSWQPILELSPKKGFDIYKIYKLIMSILPF